MKLLLTSAGLKNQLIAQALLELATKPKGELSVVFVPTASNVESGDKSWLIDDLHNLQKQGFNSIDIVDISAVPQEVWRPRIEAGDILVFGGGNPSHLMHWLDISGLGKLLPELLKTRVYVGISAGSMVVSRDLHPSQSKKLYHEALDRATDMAGLGFVDFFILPHLNSPFFTKARKEYLDKLTADISQTVYALDDDSALKVIDGNVEVVGKGEFLMFNNGGQ